jgi:hypothetical protein
MTPDQQTVLDALYYVETPSLQKSQFDVWVTAQEVSTALPSTHPNFADENWTRGILHELWTGRTVLQIPQQDPGVPNSWDEVLLRGADAYGSTDSRIPTEANDCRGQVGPWETVARYADDVHLKYRSRVAEITRLLSLNFQRFRMLPSTGLTRYERRSQRRPEYSVPIKEFAGDLVRQIAAGLLEIPGADSYHLRTDVRRAELARSAEAVLLALAQLFTGRGRPANLAPFQEKAILATLCGLYSSDYLRNYDGHVITAGVGSGKSFAFQIGALVHVGYRALIGEKGVHVLLLYPRVVLASNQFQDLVQLLEAVESQLGISLGKPVLDAGGKLSELAGAQGPPVRGQLFQAIRGAYQSDRQILISNLDTIANRLIHPEASEGLVGHLDLIVCDEVHLLSGIYGAHASMLLRRIQLLRTMWTLRKRYPQLAFRELLHRTTEVAPCYIVAASATIAEPKRHFSRVTGAEEGRVHHVDVEATEETGWVHHIFLRQRPESSSMTAAVNAVSCLVHNRRDGLYHEYYEREGLPSPLRLDEIANPAQPSTTVSPRDPRNIHKTLAFSDSLDGVNRWADLIADNERAKSAAMSAGPNPAASTIPYFVRFQEPLWRTIHHLSFSDQPPAWQARLRSHYGEMCRDCKRGVRRCVDRVPNDLRQAQRQAVDRLWDLTKGNPESYLARMGVGDDYLGSAWFSPVAAMANSPTIANLDGCGFFQSGLCWWWSRDHLGSNHPAPVSPADPLNGYKKPQENPQQKYSPLNAIRLRSFTSKTAFDLGSSINDIFWGKPNSVFRDKDFNGPKENAALVIGSPRLEVGIDLSRVNDGITFRAMRDPASLQQKVGRVGRELMSDSVVVHIVTDNARDHFYLRNPRIALDPEYLQPIPLHENNEIIARNHYFMGLFDFLVLQGTGPTPSRIGNDGDRLALINDHKFQRSFERWDAKVRGVYEFLFGSHPSSVDNLANASEYLRCLGAKPMEIQDPAHPSLGPGQAPMGQPCGAIDVFRHEFGPNFFLTPIPLGTKSVNLAEITASRWRAPVVPGIQLTRHAEYLRSLPQDDPELNRSYLFQILTLPVFLRGIPLQHLPGDQPYLWTPNYFEAVGKEYVRVFDESNNRRQDLGYETVGLSLALLIPGTVTYRYTATPRKVPVSRFGSQGTTVEVPGVFGVSIDTGDPEYYEGAGCADLMAEDLPPEFAFEGVQVPVYRARQVGLILSQSEPIPSMDGLLSDDDERPFGVAGGLQPLATPPRCFPLRWYRVSFISAPEPVRCRLQRHYSSPSGQPPIQPLLQPPVTRLFSSVTYDTKMEVTEFVWGLDRHFMTRQVEAARLIYRDADQHNPQRIALGHHYRTTGVRFEIDLRPGSAINTCLASMMNKPDSPVYLAVLDHALNAFLAESARNAPAVGAPAWTEPSRPSVFTVRNLKTLVWFHLLERWHPDRYSQSGPEVSPVVRLADVVGCFAPGHPNYIDAARFVRLCRWIAATQNPASVADRAQTLIDSHANFTAACDRIANFDQAFVLKTAEEVLLNTIGVTLHTAALRLTGAEASDLRYFYKTRTDGMADVFLFDADEFGNGTCDLIWRTFYISPVERVLVAKQRALGDNPDPLPTADFLDCFEESLAECDSSHAAHLAFHDKPAIGKALEDLESARVGERQVAGAVFDFLRNEVGLTSFDQTMLFQRCPEFLAYISQFPCYSSPLVPSLSYPTFQALESAFGYCWDGCISCVVEPEQNIHGVLAAKETVSKLLLDAIYRVVVCEAVDPVVGLIYPGQGPGRTVDFAELALCVASNMAQSPPGTEPLPIVVGSGAKATVVTVIRATSLGGWVRVFRPTWNAAPVPGQLVRPLMPL